MNSPKADGRKGLLSFRQRMGVLDWNTLSSCSMKTIIEKRDVDQLQRVLDNVTFSEFSEIDVKSQTAGAMSKLVNIMQLIIEYLLHCQEAQMKVMKADKVSIKALKKEKVTFEKEKEYYKEDTKIYQKQLQLLRQSLTKAQDMIKYPESMLSVPLQGVSTRIIFDPFEKKRSQSVCFMFSTI
jgi:zinc finger protein DZIP1